VPVHGVGNNIIGGRECAKHINLNTRKHFAHEVIQNGQMLLVKVQTASKMADILTKGLHLPHVLRVFRWSPASAVNHAHLKDLCLQEGVGSQGYQV
jgi:hypothetical protein